MREPPREGATSLSPPVPPLWILSPPSLDYLSILPGGMSQGRANQTPDVRGQAPPIIVRFMALSCFLRRQHTLCTVLNRLTMTVFESNRDRSAKWYLQESVAGFLQYSLNPMKTCSFLFPFISTTLQMNVWRRITISRSCAHEGLSE